jgi:hypothetical protein
VQWTTQASAGQASAGSSRPPPISTPLLAGALAVALLEALFARMFSHARPRVGEVA